MEIQITNNDLANWTLSEFRNKKEQVKIIAEKIKKNPDLRPYCKTVELSMLN